MKIHRRDVEKISVDADLIRAIIHMESMHGWYDAPLEMAGR
jgi:hypothetical protein